MLKRFILIFALAGATVLTASTPAYAPLLIFEATPRFEVVPRGPYRPVEPPKAKPALRDLRDNRLTVRPKEGADHEKAKDEDKDKEAREAPHHGHFCKRGDTDPSCPQPAQ
jgi:hypothetical protein